MTVKELIKLTDESGYNVVYKTVDGIELPLRIYLPEDIKKGDKRSVAFVIHGGGFRGKKDNSEFDGEMLRYHAKYFSLLGMIGIAVEYRNCDISAGPGNTSVIDLAEDCVDALQYVREHSDELYADPDKICAVGESAGGYLASYICTMEGEGLRRKADLGVIYNPITDITDSNFWYNASYNFSIDNEERNILAWEYSPLYIMDKSAPPMVLMHGNNDTTVGMSHSVKFVHRAKSLGIDCEFVEVDGAKHAFPLPNYTGTDEQIMLSLKTGEDFIRKHGFIK
jgi:dipeptidyl aminopeptidase/acylaminoacyl peptidase